MAMRDTPSILPLRLEALGFEASGRRLLEDVSLEIPAGGITCVIGPNGAGKSLLLRLCHGLIKPTAGRVVWAHGDGVMAGVRRHAMVFQAPVMLRRSARANVEHALGAIGVARGPARARAEAVMQRFGLAAFAGQPARLLSGGEKQRLAIARAWALEPQLIFLDEPSSQLDPGATRQIETMLGALAAEGVSLLMTTHDIAQARRLADRVVFLNRGRLVESGPAAEFFNAPRSPDARAFLAGELLW